ncbi:MAG: hypothetical protein ACK5MJ_08980 [Alphaproteobacteria bacterium]
MRRFIFSIIITAALMSVIFTICAATGNFLGAWFYRLTILIFVLTYPTLYFLDKKSSKD